MEKEKLYSLGFSHVIGAYILDIEHMGYVTFVRIEDIELDDMTIDEVKDMIRKEMQELKDYVRRYAR